MNYLIFNTHYQYKINLRGSGYYTVYYMFDKIRVKFV